MSDSVSYGKNPHVEPGFLYSDGMSGGTDFFFVAPWDLRRGKRPRRSRGTARQGIGSGGRVVVFLPGVNY